MLKKFKNVGDLCRHNRVKKKLSQSDLAKSLGFKNGQFISNVERFICSIPAKKAKLFCDILEVDYNLFKMLYLLDEEIYISSVFND